MGSWGTSISSNDTFADIYGEFFSLYDEGQSVKDISKKLISDNQEIIDDPDDGNNFWFALAKAQWECKQLDQKIFKKVKKIIESGSDLEVWRSLDATEKDIRKRKIVTEEFLAKLQTERPKAKLRKKKIIRQPIFMKGDCLTFKLENGNYGGAVVLEAIRDTEYPDCLIALTRINQATKPIKSDFEDAEVMIVADPYRYRVPCIMWYSPAVRPKQVWDLVEKIDSLEVEIAYDKGRSEYNSSVADFYIWFVQVAGEQFKLEETQPRIPNRQMIKYLIKKETK